MAQRELKLAEFSRRLVFDAYEPAVALVTRRLECLHLSGPIERYFHAGTIGPSSDLIALAHPGMRMVLRQAIHQAIDNDRRVVVSGAQLSPSSQPFSVDVRPTFYEGQKLFLVCLADEHHLAALPPPNPPNIHDMDAVAGNPSSPSGESSSRAEEFVGGVATDDTSLSSRNLSISERPISVENELQSLSGELSALNTELYAARERAQVTSDDLQILFSGVGMELILLDANLNISFCTPAIKSRLGVTLDEVGRPFSELEMVNSNRDLMSDVLTVLRQNNPIKREVEGEDGTWYTRHIFPYRIKAGTAEGLVIAFEDITELKLAVESLAAAKEQALAANRMRSRSLAAVSYYLREPLHSLALLQGLLEKKFEGNAAQIMVAQLDQALSTMSGMLNTLVDVDQLDAGTVQVAAERFPINDLLSRLEASFASHAKLQGLDFRMVSCSLFVRSDPRLLEQTMRILLINSLKNTARGKVLLGCRRRGSVLSIEILDTGLGIPDGQLQPLLAGGNPFHGTAAERSRGIGLSLAQRLCSLLGHRLDVTSSLGTGTSFRVEVPLLESDVNLPTQFSMQGPLMAIDGGALRTGTILVIEDDPKTHALLELLLKEEGHTVATARDEIAALEMVARGSIRPDLILADDRLLRRTDQHHITSKLEEKLPRQIPMIVLINDAYLVGVREAAFRNCVRLNKPVRAAELRQVIQRLLPPQGLVLEQEFDFEDLTASREFAIDRMKHLTERQRQIMQRVLAGDPSKNIATDLGISRRTVENHRAEIMRKTGARSIPELARMALAAARKKPD